MFRYIYFPWFVNSKACSYIIKFKLSKIITFLPHPSKENEGNVCISHC